MLSGNSKPSPCITMATSGNVHMLASPSMAELDDRYRAGRCVCTWDNVKHLIMCICRYVELPHGASCHDRHDYCGSSRYADCSQHSVQRASPSFGKNIPFGKSRPHDCLSQSRLPFDRRPHLQRRQNTPCATLRPLQPPQRRVLVECTSCT